MAVCFRLARRAVREQRFSRCGSLGLKPHGFRSAKARIGSARIHGQSRTPEPCARQLPTHGSRKDKAWRARSRGPGRARGSRTTPRAGARSSLWTSPRNSSPGANQHRARPRARTVPGGTRMPTSIKRSTANTSVTRVSCGVRRACTRTRSACSARSPGATCWRSAAARRSARGGWRIRVRMSWRSTSRRGSCGTRGASTSSWAARRCGWCRRRRPRCRSPPRVSTSCARRSARCPSWPTRRC